MKIEDHLDQLVDQCLAAVDSTSDVVPFSICLAMARAKFDEKLSEIRLVIIVVRSKHFEIVELFEAADSPPVPYIWDLRKLDDGLRKARKVPAMGQIVAGQIVDMRNLAIES